MSQRIRLKPSEIIDKVILEKDQKKGMIQVRMLSFREIIVQKTEAIPLSLSITQIKYVTKK